MEEQGQAIETVTEAIQGVEEDELNKLVSTDEEKAILQKILPVVAARANAAAEANKARELTKFIEQLKAENTAAIKAKLEEIKQANTPPTPEELEKLLSQNYLEFKVKLRGQEKEFTIGELPVAAELKLVSVIKKTLGERLQEIGRIEWEMSASLISRIIQLAELVPGVVDTLAECTVVVLDPFGENGLEKDWVLNHVSAYKIATILNAQMEVSRYRDFLSHVSRIIPGMTMG